jgi:uncharacterized protein YdaU (DUF1376 family)
MSPPWMPLYIADYRADTAHLSAAEHGAYLLLIMHYWSTGGLPDDDRPLARIACMSVAEWRRARPTLAGFFQNKWTHKRINSELARAAEISSKRRASAEQRYSKRNANAEQVDTHARASPPSPSPREDSEANASAAGAAPVDEDPRAKLFRIGKTILVSFGVGEKRTGSLIGQWLKERNDPAGLLGAIEYARDQNVAEPVAYISTLLSRAKPNGHHGKQDLSAMCFAIADELRQQERARSDGRSDELFRSG